MGLIQSIFIIKNVLYHLNSSVVNGLKGKVYPKSMLVSDVRSDKIGKNAIDSCSISPLVLKIFAFKVEELLIKRQPF